MQLPKYVFKILLIISLWLYFTMVYSLNVWFIVYLVILLICRHNGTLRQYDNDILIYCIISINAI